MKGKLPDLGSRRLFYRRVGARWRPPLAGQPAIKLEAVPKDRWPDEFIDHLLRLQELADASGCTFEAYVQGPQDDVKAAAAVVARLRLALDQGKASHRKRSLQDVANTVGDFDSASLQAVIAAALRAYAIKRTAAPGRRRGVRLSSCAEIVTAALGELMLASFREPGGFAWLLERGRPGQPSRGHRAIVQRASALAAERGVAASDLTLSRAVTEATRALRNRIPRLASPPGAVATRDPR